MNNAGYVIFYTYFCASTNSSRPHPNARWELSDGGRVDGGVREIDAAGLTLLPGGKVADEDGKLNLDVRGEALQFG